MKCSVLLLTLVAWMGSSHAQSAGWQLKPVLHKLNSRFEKESAVILQDDRVHEFAFDAKKNLNVFVTGYRLVKLIDDKGVEMFNRIYIPYNNGQIVEVKARTIKPDGTVVDVPAEKILDVEEDGKKYKKFALEGIEKNSEIEYSYRSEKPGNFFATEVFQYSNIPFEKASVKLVVPQHLLFSVKGANGFSVSNDTVVGESRIIEANAYNLPGFEDEKYAEVAPYCANVQYKLAYNLSKDKNVQLFTWNELAKNVYTGYTNFSDKELKAVAGFLKEAGIAADASEEQKIVALEQYIKGNINSDREGIGENAGRIESIVKTKVASDEGLNSLFIACFEKLGINYQIVYPSKRDELPLDEEFENYRLIDEMVFYFPRTGSFLEPAAMVFRYPYIQPYWAGTKGLFLKGTTVGSLKTAIAVFDSIPLQPYEKSAHNMEVSIKMTPEMDALKIHSRQLLTGYGATSYRPAFNYLPKDKLDEFTKSIIQSVSKSENITNIKVENTSFADGLPNKPLVIEADIESGDLVEKAGTRLFIKIGEVIGPQAQMYQEKPRQLPIAIQYPHALDRVINFTIPDGYEVKNPGDLQVTVTDEQQTMGFLSSYTLKGNELQITVHEFYKVTDYPVSMLEQFRKVINASADFNKIVLILVKKT
jgi:Domain of Unknown Function with PDB structure (DUF3857)